MESLIFTLDRDTIDSVFGYTYSRKVLQHQYHLHMSIISGRQSALTLEFALELISVSVSVRLTTIAQDFELIGQLLSE